MARFSDRQYSIPEFFKNKNVFVTGGSGFIGKLLIEKLLRSCPDVGNIYVLLREKKGKTAKERVDEMTNIPLFDQLRKHNGDSINKIIPVSGDICKFGLGLSDENRNIIVNQVNILYNIAASVRFNDPLKKSILHNVRSVREVIQLAKNLKNLTAFAHVSTVYCNADKEIIEEKLYPAHVDWRDAIQLAEAIDEHDLEIFTPKYIQPLPNTYTFTKSLAEHVVNDLCRGNMPTIIFRPAIVTVSLKEPVPAWMDNYSGTTGMAVLTGTGVIRTMYGDIEKGYDQTFVDNVVKSLIIATWKKAANREKNDEIPIYNCTDIKVSNKWMDVGLDVLKEVPFEKKLWAPMDTVKMTGCYYYYLINVILFHMIPAILLDGLLKLFGKDPLFAKLHIKIYNLCLLLLYFATHAWQIGRENYLGLEDTLLESDMEAFSFRIRSDFNTYEKRYKLYKGIILGIKEYLLKESRVVSERMVLIDKSLRFLDKTLKMVTYMFVVYVLFWKYNLQTYLLENISNYFTNL